MVIQFDEWIFRCDTTKTDKDELSTIISQLKQVL
jgi:hypothetical protein